LISGRSFTKSCIVSRHRTQRCLRRETFTNLAPTFTSIDDLVQLGLAYGAPVLVAHLKTVLRQHGSALLTQSAQQKIRYAVRVIRAACSWLLDVRYLAANPWRAVKDPRTVTREVQIQMYRALPDALWRRVKDQLDLDCEGQEEAAQWRAMRVAMLLMGESGLRREGAATATRNNLEKSEFSTAERPIWALKIVGKLDKERTVPVRMTTVAAIRAHWTYRGQAFDDDRSGAPPCSTLSRFPQRNRPQKHTR
jgi:site-specific recombinase XerC